MDNGQVRVGVSVVVLLCDCRPEMFLKENRYGLLETVIPLLSNHLLERLQ